LPPITEMLAVYEFSIYNICIQYGTHSSNMYHVYSIVLEYQYIL